VRSWARYLDENGLFERADRIKQNITQAAKTLNHANVTQKKNRTTKGKPGAK
jgi:hypothetical protein